MRTPLLTLLVISLIHSNALRLEAAGFRTGDLIVGGSNQILLVNPVTGQSEVVFNDASFSTTIFDVAFNPVTNTAFFIAGGITSPRSLMELQWSPTTGFSTSVKLSGLQDTESLTVDHEGNVLFDQENFVHHDLWRLNRNGIVERVSQPGFGTLFVPTDMELSPNGERIFVSNIPSNNLQSFDLTTGQLASEMDLSWPEGISIAVDGSIFVAEGGPGDPLSDRISIISPTGSKSTYTQQSWMEFLGSGFWGDIEYDNAGGNLYAGKGSRLYAIDRQLVARQISANSITVAGLDLITVPEPATLCYLLSATAAACLCRRRPACSIAVGARDASEFSRTE
jgi:DNA-binding beta-propeller fold protein YncE